MRSRLGTDANGVIAALVLFVVAFPILLIWGDGQWFGQDEWQFLAQRRLPTVDGLFENHNGHWITIPLVLFRVNYELFGLHTYLPYQILVVLAHLTIAGLVHMIMRRAGVGAWLATAMVVGFVFLGSGWGNILFAFQITLNGSVIAGLAQFVLADHRSRRWTRRDTAGVSIAILGLMTSAVMPAMSIGVGAFVLLNRGWKMAAGHTVPPAIVFGIWWLTFGGAEESDPQAWRIVLFAFHMVRQAFIGIGRSTPGGALLAATALVGLVSAFMRWRASGNIRPFAIPVGLLVATFSFATLTGFSRSGLGFDISTVAGAGRYVHVCSALLLPVIAIGAQQLWAFRKPLVLVPLLLIALGLPANIDSIRHRGPFTTGNRDQTLAVAHSPLLAQVPGDLKPLPFQEFRAAWLLRAVAAGDVPDLPDDLPPDVQANADATLAFVYRESTETACDGNPGELWETYEAGTVIIFASNAQVSLVRTDGRSRPHPVASGSQLEIQAGPVEVRITGPDSTNPLTCVVS